MIGVIIFAIASILIIDWFLNANPIIETVGSWDIDGYKIRLVNYCDEGEGTYYSTHIEECNGVSSGISKSMDIRTNRHLSGIKTVCNHEICHILVNNSMLSTGGMVEEDFCGSIDEKLNNPTCNKFIEMIK